MKTKFFHMTLLGTLLSVVCFSATVCAKPMAVGPITVLKATLEFVLPPQLSAPAGPAQLEFPVLTGVNPEIPYVDYDLTYKSNDRMPIAFDIVKNNIDGTITLNLPDITDVKFPFKFVPTCLFTMKADQKGHISFRTEDIQSGFFHCQLRGTPNSKNFAISAIYKYRQ